MLALPMPHLLDVLALHGHWDDVLILGRWKGWFHCLPASIQAALHPVQGLHQDTWPVQISSSSLQEIADHLSELVLATGQTKCILSVKAVKYLHAAAASLQPGFSGALNSASAQRFRYSDLDLIQTLLLCRQVHNNSRLPEVLEQAVRIALPSLAGAVSSLFSGLQSQRVPSPSTLSRASFLLDAALSFCDHQPAGPHIRYGMADSSPQHKKDWLLSMYDEINVESVIPAFRAVSALSLGQGETEEHETTIVQSLSRHNCLPQALGSGARSVAHKAKALLFAWSLGHPLQHFRDTLPLFRESFLAFVSDMGRLAQFQCAQAEQDLLPEWFGRSKEEEPLQCHETCADDGNLDEEPLQIDGVWEAASSLEHEQLQVDGVLEAASSLGHEHLQVDGVLEAAGSLEEENLQVDGVMEAAGSLDLGMGGSENLLSADAIVADCNMGVMDTKIAVLLTMPMSGKEAHQCGIDFMRSLKQEQASQASFVAWAKRGLLFLQTSLKNICVNTMGFALISEVVFWPISFFHAVI